MLYDIFLGLLSMRLMPMATLCFMNILSRPILLLNSPERDANHFDQRLCMFVCPLTYLILHFPPHCALSQLQFRSIDCIHMDVRKGTFLPCGVNRLTWPIVKLNQRVKCLCQTSSRSKVTIRTHGPTHTRPIALCRPLKRSAVLLL